MLRLEAATGFAIPGDLEGAMWRNLAWLTDNPDGLLFVPPGVDWAKPRFELHSLRECLLAFNALVRFRSSSWAAERGHHMLETMRKVIRPDGTVAYQELHHYGYVRGDGIDSDVLSLGGDMTGSTGRFIEALVWFYEATGDSLAVEIADLLGKYHLEHTLNRDGSMRAEIVDPASIGHTHSYLGTLRGLLLYGLLTRQREYVDAVAKSCRHAVPSIVKESGWAPHDLGRLRFPDPTGNPRPDSASAGDAVQLALWLARHADHVDLYDDAERWVRARLIPAQITEQDRSSSIEITPKMLGGWGIHGLPHGRKASILDVTAAVLHTLVDVREHITERTEAGRFVYLHLDHESPELRITSRRTTSAQVVVVMRQPDNLFLRIPRWAARESLRLTIQGREVRPRLVGSFLFVPRGDMGGEAEIVLRYPLPAHETEERMPAGQTYRFLWRGDEIIGINPQDERLPFYPAWEDGAE